MTGTTNDVKKRDLVVTRLFNAPLSLVWKAWTDPEFVMRWWGPEGFTSPFAHIDFREGATSIVCMSSPEYGDHYSTWRYEKIVPMQRIEYIHNLADKDGPLEEIHIDLVPILLGAGIRLFDHLDSTIELERTKVIESTGVTHLTFSIVK